MNLPVEYRPPEGRETVPPIDRVTWHKITEEDGLPETESGLWLANFPEIFTTFGPGTFAHKAPPYIPAPHGWFSDWCLDDRFSPCGFFWGKTEFLKHTNKRVYRQKLLKWIIPQRNDWWIGVERRKEAREFMGKIWKGRPRDRNFSVSDIKSHSWRQLRTQEKKRVAELHRQWSKARQGGGQSEESDASFVVAGNLTSAHTCNG